MLEARAEGARQMVDACGADAELLLGMMNVQNGIPQAAFKSAADAVQGLQPQMFSMSGDSLGAQIGQVIGGMTPVIEAFRKASAPTVSKQQSASLQSQPSNVSFAEFQHVRLPSEPTYTAPHQQ
jgi:hypothetical protein